MKPMMSSLAVLAFAVGALGALAGCTGGEVTRTPDQWKEATQKAVEAKVPELKACYVEAKKKNPELAAGGPIMKSMVIKDREVVEVTIDHAILEAPEMTIGDSSGKGTTTNGNFAQCVRKALRGLEAPRPQDKNVAYGKWRIVFEVGAPDAS